MGYRRKYWDETHGLVRSFFPWISISPFNSLTCFKIKAVDQLQELTKLNPYLFTLSHEEFSNMFMSFFILD